MGDMADWYVDQMIERGAWFGRRRDTRTLREKNQAQCKHCGSDDVHWHETSEGWRLFDNERQHPGNRYVQHVCPNTNSAEGFDDEPIL